MYVVGIDLGGTNIKAGIIDEEGKIIAKSSIPTNAKRPAREVALSMAEQAEKLIADAALDKEQVAGIGIGSPGAINSASGVVDYSNNLGWTSVPLGPIIAEKTGRRVMVSNDANVAALGETVFGSGKKYSDTVLLTLGTGVGGGIVIGNKLFEGNESKGAELGHTVIVAGGEECTCGRKGCLEAYASATALIRDTKRAMLKDRDSKMWAFAGGDIEKVDGRTAFECSKTGDRSAKAVVDRYVFYLTEGILNFCNVFRPQAIILGGGVCAQGAYLTDKIKAIMEKEYYGFRGSPKVELLIAELGNDAGIVGAASLIVSAMRG